MHSTHSWRANSQSSNNESPITIASSNVPTSALPSASGTIGSTSWHDDSHLAEQRRSTGSGSTKFFVDDAHALSINAAVRATIAFGIEFPEFLDGAVAHLDDFLQACPACL